MSARLLRAVPGHWGAPRVPPIAAIEHALAGIARLGQGDQEARLFGFLDPPPVTGLWCASSLTLTTSIEGSAYWQFGGDERRGIGWLWTTVWEEAAWYEPGWMPDRRWFALTGPAAQRLWRAVNAREIWRMMP